ncbi:hypothetical protein [Vibrio aestuarianus]|uniref:Uncharacterized protein n=1 Tax=Vibrio aestuarianus TaxID=28171 RepID=A0A9X4F8P8_9VIBR|nr:hypothetical protein [Vibrio aestuarianus]MDE1345580.1 hypothetical protein [Vibrio aestuarianus]
MKSIDLSESTQKNHQFIPPYSEACQTTTIILAKQIDRTKWNQSMDDVELDKKLKSVGKAAFVSHYELFRDFTNGRISRADAIETLVTKKVSNEAGAAIRVGNAKLIFENSREQDALDLILQSNRVDNNIRDLARKLRR